MSISDMIVVMKDGVIHQMGKPQDVYDDPQDLFVAKFLGTPPINVFAGRVEGNMLYIGEEKIMRVSGIADCNVVAAIRPEGLVPDENGVLTCDLKRVEVMGRDVSVVCSHNNCENEDIRAIVDGDVHVNPVSCHVKFSIKPHKLFLFDAQTQQRLSFEG